MVSLSWVADGRANGAPYGGKSACALAGTFDTSAAYHGADAGAPQQTFDLTGLADGPQSRFSCLEAGDLDVRAQSPVADPPSAGIRASTLAKGSSGLTSDISFLSSDGFSFDYTAAVDDGTVGDVVYGTGDAIDQTASAIVLSEDLTAPNGAPFGGTGPDCLLALTSHEGDSASAPLDRVALDGTGAAGSSYERGGLTLKATCEEVGGSWDLGVIARSARPNTLLRAGMRPGLGIDGTYGSSDLDPGEKVNVLAPADERSLGKLVYSRPDGVNQTIPFLAEEDDFAGDLPCAFLGTSTLAKP